MIVVGHRIRGVSVYNIINSKLAVSYQMIRTVNVKGNLGENVSGISGKNGKIADMKCIQKGNSNIQAEIPWIMFAATIIQL